MKPFLFVTLVLGLPIISSTTADSSTDSGFGYELLITQIEELQARLQQQNLLERQLEQATKQINDLQKQLKEVQDQSSKQLVLQQQVVELQRKLSQSQTRFNLVIPNVHQHQPNAWPKLFDDGIVNSSCKQAPNVSGIYQIRAGPYVVRGYCEQTEHGGGWLVVQRRSTTGTVNFNRTWTEFRNGFGDADADHWLGLEVIHQLTHAQNHQLLVELTTSFADRYEHVRWGSFQLGSEMQQYRVNKLRNCSGSASCYGLAEDEPFNTHDRINSEWCQDGENIEGWWYRLTCDRENINAAKINSMAWYLTSVKASKMMIKTVADV